MQFYATFVDLCRKNGVSPSYVAQSLGFSKSAATRWKQDTATPTNKTVKKIADYFGVPTSYFFDDDTNSNSAMNTKEKTADVKDINGREEAERRQLIKTAAELANSMPTEKLRRLIKILKDE